MANTSARPEQAFDQVDHKVTQKSDGGAVSAAQAAYQPGTKMEFKAQKQKDGTLEFTPLFNPPESSSNAMGKAPDNSGWAPYETLNLQIRPINRAQPNSNAMRSSETPPDENIRPAKKIEKLGHGSTAAKPDEDVRPAKKVQKLLDQN